MIEWWNRLTPHQLRWLAIAVGAIFLILLLMSSFFSDLSAGLGFAIDRAELKLIPQTVPCPQGKICLDGATTTDHFIDVPLKFVFGVSVLLGGTLLHVASSRNRQASR
jgi:hypothetical protein